MSTPSRTAIRGFRLMNRPICQTEKTMRAGSSRVAKVARKTGFTRCGLIMAVHVHM